MNVWFKRVRWSAWLLALVVAALGWSLHQHKLGAPLTNSSHDWLFSFRGNIPITNAVVIYLDEESHQQLGQPFNAAWDRTLHARLIDRLTRAGATAVVMDIVFSDPGPSTNADLMFAQAIKQNGHVVLAADAKEGTTAVLVETKEPDVVPPTDLLRDAANDRWGLAQMSPSYDQVIRIHPPSFNFDKVSLSWQAARFLGVPFTQQEGRERDERWMNYYGPANHVPHCSFFEAIHPQVLSDDFFRNRVIFVGASTLTKYSGERKDAYVTPFSRWVQDPKQLFIAGVEVQAIATLNLLRGDWLTRIHPRSELTIIVLLGLVMGFSLALLRPTFATITALMLMLLTAYLAYFVFTRKSVIFPWLILEVQILVAWLCSVAVNSVRLYVENRLFVQSLEMYLSPKLVKKFATDKERKLLKPGANNEKLTILFSDIEKFTSITEGMDPDELCQMMNEYFQGAVGGCIHHTDGTVVKYIGDAIFAFWNAPDPQSDHAVRACEAALRFREQSKIPVRNRKLVTRIGLHTGVAKVGNFGSDTRVDYTALGENINLASRMEGLNKFLGTDVLITGDVKKEIGDRFITRYLGRFQLKGFEKSVDVYELVALRDSGSAPAWHREFEEGLRHFQQRDFGAASMSFDRVLQSASEETTTKFYLKHLKEVVDNPPPENWSGEVELKEK
jgi:adenylate cyclase